MSCEAKKLPRPPLSGLFDRKIKQNLTMTFIVTAAGSLVYFWTYVLRRQKAYANYYRNLDCEEEFQKIMATGAFDSCKPVSGDAKKKK